MIYLNYIYICNIFNVMFRINLGNDQKVAPYVKIIVVRLLKFNYLHEPNIEQNTSYELININ